MKTINIYTENEIDILKAFYKEKVINKTLNSSSPFKITDLVSEKIKTKYQLMCIGYLLKQPHIIVKIDISSLCIENSLLSPSEVLKDQD
tara:strand:- start:42 stop:308 length:267 start_codon:yes stop_codon:yes gene_type:complete